MKNIINDKPPTNLKGRLRFSMDLLESNEIRNKKILDIGCGYGWFELNILKNNPKKITGIEISREDLKTAIANVKNKDVDFKIGTAVKLPFKNNSFDLVVAWEVIEHIDKGSEAKMFNEISRVLKKGGVFCLSTPYRSFLSVMFDPAFWIIGHRHYSDKQLVNLGKTVGFKVVNISVKGGLWSLVELLNMYISKWIFRKRPFLENIMLNKVDTEYKKQYRGFMNIFVKYKNE